MKIETTADWTSDVWPCWQRAAHHPEPNSDIWQALPSGVRWVKARIEPADINGLYLIGSSDLCDTFGSYRVSEIAREMVGQDDYRHHDRVRELIRRIEAGAEFERLIVVAEDVSGPFVVLDGNHRCLAHWNCGTMPGVDIFLGMAPSLIRRFKWSWHLQQAA